MESSKYGYSRRTEHVLRVLEHTVNELVTAIRFGSVTDDEHFLALANATVIKAIKEVAGKAGVGYSTVADKCRRRLGTNSAGFINLIIDFMSGGSLLQHSFENTYTEGDNPTSVRVAITEMYHSMAK